MASVHPVYSRRGCGGELSPSAIGAVACLVKTYFDTVSISRLLTTLQCDSRFREVPPGTLAHSVIQSYRMRILRPPLAIQVRLFGAFPTVISNEFQPSAAERGLPVSVSKPRLIEPQQLVDVIWCTLLKWWAARTLPSQYSACGRAHQDMRLWQVLSPDYEESRNRQVSNRSPNSDCPLLRRQDGRWKGQATFQNEKN
ncbi:hypothetical protein CC1G_15557 [Coprinopsis cinerea okayama7|uniref:Uncharacterized protein n=1 Tax=Coprinopsis cinerea (strain Okayama-7 / 130 / ATCC MYA-4618 / FGSC 9003) TaxID=240176 RepID=D6RN60_COPC7|nr:hypothetical protein CC1G_15557 [Coprinopsis cinerea okayama7\|eukprot:XP_002911015.1 hypothetical protein CC1G_15557 [Coprinopsis cinerea okayama7\